MPDLYFLIEFPIFRELEADDVDALATMAEELSLPAGAAVVREGEPADAMYIVKSGVLNVCRQVQGEIKHINLLSAGEFFGEMALIDGSPRSADVLVKEAAVLVRLGSEAFKRLKKEKPATALKVAEVLLKTLSFRVRRSTTRALTSESKPAPAVAAAALPLPKKPARAKARKAAKPKGKKKSK